MSDLAKRLMKKHYTDEDGAAAAGGSAAAASGASVTGNAGLSALGPPPSGVMGVVKGKKKKHRECRSCGFVTKHENVKICYECGDRLPALNEKSMEERLADYRTEQINLDKSDVNGFNWIDSAVDQIMTMMKTGYPQILHEDDELSDAALRERVTNMLHGFANWRTRLTEGNTF